MSPLTRSNRLYVSRKRASFGSSLQPSQSSPRRSVPFYPIVLLSLTHFSLLLQVFIGLNLNCEIDFIAFLATENDKFDSIGKNQILSILYVPGRFSRLMCVSHSGFIRCSKLPDLS